MDHPFSTRVPTASTQARGARSGAPIACLRDGFLSQPASQKHRRLPHDQMLSPSWKSFPDRSHGLRGGYQTAAGEDDFSPRFARSGARLATFNPAEGPVVRPSFFTGQTSWSSSLPMDQPLIGNHTIPAWRHRFRHSQGHSSPATAARVPRHRVYPPAPETSN